MIPRDLDVEWTHDRMRVLIPVWRDRSPLWLAVIGAVGVAVIWLGAAYLLGAVAIVWTTWPDGRKVVLELDAEQVTIRHRWLFRERVERFPLHGSAVGGRDDWLVLGNGSHSLAYRWMGSPASLHWLRDQIDRARATAVAPVQTPEPPPELWQLHARAQTPQAPANTTSGSSHTPV